MTSKLAILDSVLFSFIWIKVLLVEQGALFSVYLDHQISYKSHKILTDNYK